MDPEFYQRDQPLDFELVDSEDDGGLPDLELPDEEDLHGEDEEIEDLDDAGLEKLLSLVEDSKMDSSSQDKLQKIGLDIDWLTLSMSSQDSQGFQANDKPSVDVVTGADLNESMVDDLDNLLDLYGTEKSDDLDKLFQQDLLSGFGP